MNISIVKRTEEGTDYIPFAKCKTLLQGKKKELFYCGFPSPQMETATKWSARMGGDMQSGPETQICGNEAK